MVAYAVLLRRNEDRSASELGHLCVTDGRDLVETSSAVDDPGARRAKLAERSRHEFSVLGPRDADELTGRRRGIRQRSKQVERCA